MRPGASLHKSRSARDAVLVLCFIGAVAPASSWAEPGWILEQRGHVAGELTVFLTLSALKVVNKRSGVVLVVEPGAKDIVLFNPAKKVKRTVSIDKWDGGSLAGAAAAIGEQWDTFVWHKTGVVTACGLKALEYQTSERKPGAPPELFKVYRATCRVGQDLKTERRLSTVIEKIYQLPRFGMVPLSLTYKRKQSGREVSQLETLKASTGSLAPSVFAVPKGLKPVSRDTELIEEEESLIRDMNFF